MKHKIRKILIRILKLPQSRDKSQVSSLKFQEKGFTLVEAIIAIFVITVGVGSVFMVVQQVLRSIPEPVARLEALYLAQEGVEIVRNIRDTNFTRVAAGQTPDWLDGLSGCDDGCEADYRSEILEPSEERNLRLDGGFYSYEPSGQQTSFQRTIIVEPNSEATEADVTVLVTWTVRGSERSAEVATKIYNWLE